MSTCPHCGEKSWVEGDGCEFGCHRIAEFQSVDHQQRATIRAQAARIERLEAALATARNDALREAADWHMTIARHDESGMEYSSMVGVPISNWNELDTSVKTHEWCAREITNLITEEPS